MSTNKVRWLLLSVFSVTILLAGPMSYDALRAGDEAVIGPFHAAVIPLTGVIVAIWMTSCIAAWAWPADGPRRRWLRLQVAWLSALFGGMIVLLLGVGILMRETTAWLWAIPIVWSIWSIALRMRFRKSPLRQMMLDGSSAGRS